MGLGEQYCDLKRKKLLELGLKVSPKHQRHEGEESLMEEISTASPKAKSLQGKKIHLSLVDSKQETPQRFSRVKGCFTFLRQKVHSCMSKRLKALPLSCSLPFHRDPDPAQEAVLSTAALHKQICAYQGTLASSCVTRKVPSLVHFVHMPACIINIFFYHGFGERISLSLVLL